MGLLCAISSARPLFVTFQWAFRTSRPRYMTRFSVSRKRGAVFTKDEYGGVLSTLFVVAKDGVTYVSDTGKHIHGPTAVLTIRSASSAMILACYRGASKRPRGVRYPRT